MTYWIFILVALVIGCIVIYVIYDNSSATATTATTTASDTTTTDVSTEEETAGPFPTTIETTVERSTLYDSNVTGVPLSYTILVQNTSGVPQSGIKVCIWHASSTGIYSDEAVQTLQSVDTTAYTWLRGYQITDTKGQVSFVDYMSSGYNSRAPHVHVRVITFDSDGTTIATNETTQIFYPQAINDAVKLVSPYSTVSGNSTTNAEDSIYDSTLLMTISGSVTAGYTGTYTITIPLEAKS